MRLNNRTRLLLILGLLLLLFCAGVSLRDLTFPDELRYAEVAREMIESGNFVLPGFNYEVYADKPPVFFWMVAAAMKAVGPCTLAAALPSILAALLCVWLTYLLGKELFDPPTALRAAWVLSSFVVFLLMAQVVRMDMTLTMLITASLYLFFLVLRKRGGVLALVFGYLCIGIALITKGPVGLILPAVTILSYLVLTGQKRGIRRLHPGWGLLILCAVPLLWLIPAGLSGGADYLHEILLKQSAGRVVQSFSHAQPVYYYVLAFPLLFVPWSTFLLFFLDRGVRSDITTDRDAILFLVSWVVGTIVFFSLISGKIVIYLLPIIPALALLVARAWTPLLTDRVHIQKAHLFRIPVYLVGGIYMTSAVALYVMAQRSPFLKDARLILPSLLILVPGGGLLCYYGYRMAVTRCFVSTGLISLLLTGTLTLWLVPGINPYLSLRPMAQRILAIQKERPRVGGYKVDLRYLSYYLHAPYRKLNSTEELNRFAEKGPAFLVADQEDLPLIVEAGHPPLLKIGRFQIKGMTYFLFVTPNIQQCSLNLEIG